MTSRKLQIGKLSIWFEDERPRSSGLPRDEAQSAVRAWIAEAQRWLDASEGLAPEDLTAAEQKKAAMLATKKGFTPETAASAIRNLRGVSEL